MINRGRTAVAVLLSLLSLATLLAPPARGEVPSSIPPPGEGSVLVPCERAAERVVLTVSSHLDPSCTYTGGFDIVASDVVLDCQGARVANSAHELNGIEFSSPSDVDMSGSVVRHCRTEGFLNGIRATRVGFEQMPAGEEFDHNLSHLTIEDSEVSASFGVGIFIDGYVSDVTIQRVSITGAGGSGIYLEAGSHSNTVRDNVIHDNGYRENSPNGQIARVDGLRFRFFGTGREGLSIDGSWNNTVAGNDFSGNSAGSILVYTNCGEYYLSRPERWFERWHGAEDNVIEGNQFHGGIDGVWVGSRMDENTYAMECSNTPYYTGPFVSYTFDRAKNNTVRNNYFEDVTYGVRVEDDGAVVEGNTFVASDPTHHAVIVGTKNRITYLGQPVKDATVRGNRAFITGNTDPYRWTNGVDNLVEADNQAFGTRVPICQGPQLPHNFMLFSVYIFYEPAGTPATPRPDPFVIPQVGALDPCPRPRATPGQASAVEGGAGSGNVLRVPITLDAPSTGAVTVDWTTLDVDSPFAADVGEDYVASSGTVRFAPGQTVAEAVVPLVGDNVPEPNELVVVSFRAPPVGARMGGFWGLGFGTVNDDDRVPVAVPGTASVVEGDGEATMLEIPVTLTEPASGPVSVAWTTVAVPPGALGALAVASAGLDFTPASGTLAFAPGETTGVLRVPIIGDTDDEPDETVLIALTNAVGLRIGGPWGLGAGTIVDDDASSSTG